MKNAFFERLLTDTKQKTQILFMFDCEIAYAKVFIAQTNWIVTT